MFKFIYITLLLFNLLSISSYSQIVIKDTIEIEPPFLNKLKENTLIDTPFSSIIMPTSGFLYAASEYLKHLDYPEPDYSTLNAHLFKSDSTITDSIILRFGPPFGYIWPGLCGVPNRQEYVYSSVYPHEIELGHVNTGDTVRFTYFSDWVATQDTHTYPIFEKYLDWYEDGPSWLVLFGNHICNYYTQRIFDNYLEVNVWIEKDYQLIVNVEPEVLYPGDTANVIIKKKLPDGTIVEFDTSQTFEVAKLEGCIWGNILAEDSLSAYFYGVHRPIKFVVDTSSTVIDSLVSDTGRVLISVGVIPENKKSHTHLKRDDVTDCFTGILEIQDTTQSQADIYNPLEIIAPVPGTIDWISDIPEMPDIQCKAIMKGDNFWEEVTFDWEFVINDSISRHSQIRPDTLCPRIGIVKIIGTSFTNYSDTTYWNVSFDSSHLKSVEFRALQPTIPRLREYGGNCDKIIDSWIEGENIFTGGIDSVKVIARNSYGKIIGIKGLKIGSILGSNPSQEAIRVYVNSNELYAIIKHESNVPGAVGMHFNSHDNGLRYRSWYLDGSKYERKGYPVYGPPNGFGCAQIDNPPPTEMDLWNWKHMINTAGARWDSCINYVNKYEDSVHATRVDSIYYMNAYQHYNGDLFWYWHGDIDGWKENNKNRRYGREVYYILLNLNQNKRELL